MGGLGWRAGRAAGATRVPTEAEMRWIEAAIEINDGPGPSWRHECCAFVRLVLVQLFGAETIDTVPMWRWHLNPAGLGVGEDLDPFEPVLAAHAAGVTTGNDELVVGRWHIVQGWRGTPFAKGVSGHTFLWLAITDRYGIRLDSTSSTKLRIRGALWSEQLAEFPELELGVLRRVARRRGAVDEVLSDG